MNIRAVLLVVVAFALGALAAGSVGVRVIREVNTTEDASSLPAAATSSTTTLPATTYQVDESETLIASTSLVPTSIEASPSSLAIGYDLITLSPHLGVPALSFVAGFGVVTTIENADLDHVYPRTWRVETHDGETFEGGPANASTRFARFDVDEGFSTSEIKSVEITEALAPFAVQETFTLSEAEPETEVVDGLSVSLLNISVQGETTIVQVELDIENPDDAGFLVVGDGPGWRSAVFEAEGRPRVTLTWVAGDLPDEIPLQAIGTVWVPIEGAFEISLEGVT
ncbi:MAG: hypothetical protein ACR2N2_04425 [Acidimicrobiia bacterium]